ARFNLFDIDRLISAAAAYSILSIILIASLPTVVLPSARWLSTSAGLEQGTMQVLLSGSLATAMVWTRGLARPYLDRVIFPERYRLAARMNDLLQELSAARDRTVLLERVVSTLDRILMPGLCAAYVRTGDGFQLVHATGTLVPPAALESTSPLLAALQSS